MCRMGVFIREFLIEFMVAWWRVNRVLTVNASFYVFPSFKFSVILNLVKDNLYTFVYNYFQTLKGNNYYGKREKRYFTDRLYA